MKTRFHALDAFRGICAISVVLFHLQILGAISEWRFFREAEIFVEFFFVLSGFVLAHGYGYKQKLPFLPFIQARIWRLFPLHIVMLFAFILLELGKLFAYKHAGIHFNSLPFTEQNHISEIVPNLLLIQSWVGAFDHLSFNYPSWSISVEFYLYLILYFTIAAFSKTRQLSWVIISIVSLVSLGMQSDTLTPQAIKGLACFFSGATTYLIYRKIYDVSLSKLTATLLEISLILTTVVLVISEFPFKPIASVFVFSSMVLLFSFESGFVSRILLQTPLQYAGKLSYSIYMTHAAILLCLQSVFMVLEKLTHYKLTIMFNDKRYLTLGNEIANNFLVFSVVLIVLLVSHFSYHYIEVVGQRFNRSRAQRSFQAKLSQN